MQLWIEPLMLGYTDAYPMAFTTDPLLELEHETQNLTTYMHRRSRSVFGRYPLLFSLLTTFGVVSILYGFDDILNEIPLTHDHPVIPLIIGILILVGTGSLYKRLEKKFD